MNLTFFSDTHAKHREVTLGKGDVLIHCGDITRRGSLDELRDFAIFMSEQDFTHKVVIAGNHDFCFDDDRKEDAEDILKKNNIIYLNDSGINIDGVNFWGSPIQPEYFNWAFNRDRGEAIKKHWDLIPSETDVLITHGPPFGILDLCSDGQRVGCEDLLLRVKELVNLKVLAFGHIHEDYGVKVLKDVTYINACSLNLDYEPLNPPISFEL